LGKTTELPVYGILGKTTKLCGNWVKQPNYMVLHKWVKQQCVKQPNYMVTENLCSTTPVASLKVVRHMGESFDVVFVSLI